MKNTSQFNLLLWSSLTLFPILVLVLWAFSEKWIYPSIFPSEFTWKHFQMASQEPAFWPAVKNSISIGLIATITTLIIGMPAAKYFAFQNKLSARAVQVLIYLPLILPAISVITSLQVAFIQLGLSSTYRGVIIIHVYYMLPYALQILVESYRKVGTGFELTAKSLGANSWQNWWKITYPLLKPGISTAAMLVFIISLSQYLPTFFIGGGKIMTLPMILLPYANNGRYAMASVYSLVFLLIAIIITEMIKLVIGRRHNGR